MSTHPALRIGLGDVARLAGVRRPVASMWRRRFAADSDDPFPLATTIAGGRPFFDALEVARWLERTAHGNNREAIADAAASAAPAGFDFAAPAHIDTVDALLTLRAVDGRPLAGVDVAELMARAIAADPHDACLVTEITRPRPELAAWAEWAEALADAAYSPSGGVRVLARRHAATMSAAGSLGPLIDEASELLLALATALCTSDTSVVHFGSRVAAGFATTMLQQLDGNPDATVPATTGGRRIRRHLLAHGLASPIDTSAGPRVFIERLPAGTASTTNAAGTPAAILHQIDDLVLSMRSEDRALLLAPAAVLTDPMPASDRARSDVLRSGRVRAIVRLGGGVVTSAPREAFALWVLGPPVGEVAIADRFTAVADLTGVELTPATRADLTSDVLAAMGSARAVRAHAFRFTRLARTASLLAARGSLVTGATSTTAPKPDVSSRPGPTHERARPHELPALIDQSLERLGPDAPTHAPVAASTQTAPAASVDALLQERHLRVVPGTRVGADEFSAEGLVAVTVHDLDDPSRIGRNRIDPLEFAARHPSARLTLPGDIVFRTAPTPRAWVDTEGASVVVAPARVLRINPNDPGGLMSELVAEDIAHARAGAGAWRRWMLRRVAPAHVVALRAALADISERRAALANRMDALDAYSALLTAGIVAGTVTLSDPAATQASTPR